MDICQKCTMNGGRFRLSDNMKSVPPRNITRFDALYESGVYRRLAHDIAPLGIPHSRDCQPDFGGV